MRYGPIAGVVMLCVPCSFLIPSSGRLHRLHTSMATGERLLEAIPWSDETPPWRWHRHADWTANDAELDPEMPEDIPWSQLPVPADGVEFQVRRSRAATGTNTGTVTASDTSSESGP